jgi:altronate hydrolase
LEGEEMNAMAERLYDRVLAVASGEKLKSEKAGFHDMAIFKKGVTL